MNNNKTKIFRGDVSVFDLCLLQHSPFLIIFAFFGVGAFHLAHRACSAAGWCGTVGAFLMTGTAFGTADAFLTAFFSLDYVGKSASDNKSDYSYNDEINKLHRVSLFY